MVLYAREADEVCSRCTMFFSCHRKQYNRTDLRKQLKHTGKCPEFKSVHDGGVNFG